MGCGDAELAASVPQRVHSFDLVAANPRVTACDIAHLPLADGSLDVAVFCLALMGANYADFLREAHRVLRARGVLMIAEVRSRIEDMGAWLGLLRGLGFELRARDESNTHFVLLELRKSATAAGKPPCELDPVPLKACVYKKR